MPGMPGMPGPGMPQRPSGIPMAGAVRKGTPKIVPVVVSAGLAVGVFCGLYFGLGTGEPKEAEAQSTAKASGVSGPQSAAGATDEKINFKSADKPPSELAAGSGSDTAGSATPPPGTGSATTPPPGTGSATTPPPGTGSATTPPAEVTLEVTFAVTPEDAEITVDGQPVTGGKLTITFGDDDKKTVRVVVKAKGYKTSDKKMTFTKDTASETVEIKLGKKGSSGPRPPRDRDNDREPPGGLIDL
jgi:hypothetical protein